MANVKPKLYLNMSPKTQEENTLAFARNMKVDDDGSLVSDYGYKNISRLSGYSIVGHIVGLNNKIYFFTRKNNVVPEDRILEYDEDTESESIVQCGWTYSGGMHIDGYVSTNQSGEIILTVAESGAGVDVPLKHINLSTCGRGENESLYTQAPKVPTLNLKLYDTYSKTIPNGVYVFFVRYKIRKDVYTDWFLCSRPMFSGTSENMVTIQGGLKYINTHKDSAKSFMFDVDWVTTTVGNKELYQEFQLGFIITHDEATDARIWKTFKKNTTKIYFDYENVTETNIDDLLKATYELYNVGNVTAFKNKLYISNYKETNFNEISSLNNKIYIGFTEGTSINENNIHNAVVLRMPMSDTIVNYTLQNYNKTIGGYTNANSDTIKALLQNYLSQTYSPEKVLNFLDVDFSDFYKEESTELKNAISVQLTGNDEYDPDIIYVKSLTNNLVNAAIFGNNFTKSYGSTGHDWNDVGLSVAPESSAVDNEYYIIDIFGTSVHPWHRKNFTYAYGLFGVNAPVPPSSVFISKGMTIPISYSTLRDNPGKCKAARSHITSEIRSTVKGILKDEIEKSSKFIIGYLTITNGTNVYYLDSIDFTPNNTRYTTKEQIDTKNYVGYDDSVDYGVENVKNIKNTNIQYAVARQIGKLLYDKVAAIDDTGNIVFNINGTYIKTNTIGVTFKECSFTLEDENENRVSDDTLEYDCRFDFSLNSTTYTTIATFNIFSRILKITEPSSSSTGFNQQATLMPLSKYDAYVHLVDEHNIVSNGIKVTTLDTTTVNFNPTSPIMLQYNVGDVTGLEKYKSFFISLKSVGDIVIQGFDYHYDNNNQLSIINVLEADALLYNLNDNIKIKVYIQGQSVPVTYTGKYYPSGASFPSLAFGNCGFVAWKTDTALNVSACYICIERSNSQYTEENAALIKATPYLPLVTASQVTITDGFYGSYLCAVKKPSFDLASIVYVSGNDVYSIKRGAAISLKDFNNFITQQDSQLFYIRSTFNLNYLSLTQDIAEKYYRIGSGSNTAKQVVRTLDSMILSSIYELKSMYKDFANKTFRAYTSDNKVTFNNTIRVSRVLSDETFNNSIFKFDAEDYYNIPTDRGIIVNLFAIGNNIFAHTKSSFYKFDANQTITASQSDITLQEAEPFDAGITQIFDSEYGYGGIYNKEAGCITFDSYFFYDYASNHIFAYGGNSQVNIIDGSIFKLLSLYKPKMCKTLHDDKNHRVLFDFIEGSEQFTLSYNYKSKSFVSIHDITLNKAFASRNKSYSYNGSLCELFDVTEGISNVYHDQSVNVLKLFGDATRTSTLQFGGSTQQLQSSCFVACVVAFPKEYSKENINFVGIDMDVIESPIKDINSGGTFKYSLIDIPQHNRNFRNSGNPKLPTNPVNKMFIVTDCCISTPISGTVDDTARPQTLKQDPPIPNSLLDYKGFKYDAGSWNTNYFRNDLNKNNVYQYTEQPRSSQNPNADNNSLVYGRYFILVLDFIKDKPIKLESIFINSNKY